MTAVDSRGEFSLPVCSRRDVARKLAYWDDLQNGELAELETHAVRCAVCGPRLSILKRAQEVLESTRAPEGCPPAEDLYDFGRGPGHQPLAAERLSEIQGHIVHCQDCRAHLATLESRPPLPLDLSPAVEAAHVGPRRRLWIAPLTAAAGLLAAALIWEVARRPSAAAETGPEVAVAATGHVYPEKTTVRGIHDGPLVFPRGAVLASADGGPHFGLKFEMLAEEGASEYRVKLYRQTDDVFVPGELISVFRHTGPGLVAPASLSAQLTPGGYTWEAWCVVDGLDKSLGRLDFDVISDPELLARLAILERLEEPQRGTSILTLLHGHHLETDLRAFAGTLPPSDDRDRFLALPR